MATKREVMAAGTPFELARMLGSDNPLVVEAWTPPVPLKSNFVLIDASRQYDGVQLPPAMGQYLHILRNTSDVDVTVVAAPGEVIDALSEMVLMAGAIGLFIPSRQQWQSLIVPGAQYAPPAPPISISSSGGVYLTGNVSINAYSAAGPIDILLTDAAYDDQVVKIKDAGGRAGTNNIRVLASTDTTIDGLPSYTIGSNYGSIELVWISAVAMWGTR